MKVHTVRSVLLNHWLLSGYVAILFISWGVISIHSVGEAVNKRVEINNIETEDTTLYKEMVAGKLNQAMDKRPYKKWFFPRLQGNQLYIKTEEIETVPKVVVERKKVNDGKIEVVNFKAMATINGRELVANPIGIRLVGNMMILQNPKKRVLHYSEFKNPFAVMQFTGKSGIEDSNFFEGQNLLYLKIPPNVDIAENPNLEIKYTHH